ASVFTSFQLAEPLFALAMIVLISIGFSAMGLIVAIWADKFEQVNFVPTFVVTPMTFLGGVFYSAKILPPVLATITRLNPIFYMVDGVRYGMLGISDGHPWLGLGLVLALCVVSNGIALQMLRTGYKLRG